MNINNEEGFEFNDVWITDPTKSECGRFEVDPKEYYGIDKQIQFKKSKGHSPLFFGLAFAILCVRFFLRSSALACDPKCWNQEPVQ